MDKGLDEFLSELGLTETESKLYLDLLKIGPCSIAELTRESGIPRTTVRENIDKLAQKGLLSQTFEGARKKLAAEEPNKVKLLIIDRKLDLENRKKELDSMEENFNFFVAKLQKQIPEMEESSKVDVRYYEGKEQVEIVYDEILDADKVRSFADLERYYEVYPNTMYKWIEAFDKNENREYWDIIITSKEGKDILQDVDVDRYHFKFLDLDEKDLNFADLITYDDKFALVQLQLSDPRAVVIDSDIVVESQKFLHKYMWDLLD